MGCDNIGEFRMRWQLSQRSDGQEYFEGWLSNISDVVTFEASNIEGLYQEAMVSIEDYLEDCRELGRDIPFISEE